MAAHRSTIRGLRGMYRPRSTGLLNHTDMHHMARETNFPSLGHLFTKMAGARVDYPCTIIEQEQPARFLSPEQSPIAVDKDARRREVGDEACGPACLTRHSRAWYLVSPGSPLNLRVYLIPQLVDAWTHNKMTQHETMPSESKIIPNRSLSSAQVARTVRLKTTRANC